MDVSIRRHVREEHSNDRELPSARFPEPGSSGAASAETHQPGRAEPVDRGINVPLRFQLDMSMPIGTLGRADVGASTAAPAISAARVFRMRSTIAAIQPDF